VKKIFGIKLLALFLLVKQEKSNQSWAPEAMEQWDEALNASSLQFCVSISRFIALIFGRTVINVLSLNLFPNFLNCLNALTNEILTYRSDENIFYIGNFKTILKVPYFHSKAGKDCRLCFHICIRKSHTVLSRF
jgi:hypothetical protein